MKKFVVPLMVRLLLIGQIFTLIAFSSSAEAKSSAIYSQKTKNFSSLRHNNRAPSLKRELGKVTHNQKKQYAKTRQTKTRRLAQAKKRLNLRPIKTIASQRKKTASLKTPRKTVTPLKKVIPSVRQPQRLVFKAHQSFTAKRSRADRQVSFSVSGKHSTRQARSIKNKENTTITIQPDLKPTTVNSSIVLSPPAKVSSKPLGNSDPQTQEPQPQLTQPQSITSNSKTPLEKLGNVTPKINVSPTAVLSTPPIMAQTTVLTPPHVLTPQQPLTRLDYFSLYPPITQKKLAYTGINKLFRKNYYGQGQTVAVIEYSGTWGVLGHNDFQHIHPKMREFSQKNFLPIVLAPGTQTDHIMDNPNSPWVLSHGAEVSDVILASAPNAKVLPVNSHYSKQITDKYDSGDAVLALAKRQDVKVINISSGSIKHWNEVVDNEKGESTYKQIISLSYFDAFKAAAKAGKVIVIAAGNEGEEIPITTPYRAVAGWDNGSFFSELLNNLDDETRQSIIIAGNMDLDLNERRPSSNMPGRNLLAQDRFLYAPGETLSLNSNQGSTTTGTSFSAPLIAAAIADLLSYSDKITPRQAAKALLETAELRPGQRHIYGRGIMRADVALEYLEEGLITP